ncbi:MAG TPA: GNAT family N-acetyltransferase [Symbiobacteriaceae bacterium]|nr:GNAT family N-acetyltransferase [Symbiobacteriaceae bacterium]
MIRNAISADLDAILDLAEARRLTYEGYQPVFWRKAPDSREKQRPFLTVQLARENMFALVHETDGRVDGFLIAAIVPSPPVYNPGGPTCSVDDYCVAEPLHWSTVGAELLEAAAVEAKARGAAQMVVVVANRDLPKRAMLDEQAYSIASEWWTKPL